MQPWRSEPDEGAARQILPDVVTLGPVETAVTRDLAGLERRKKGLSESSEAALALALAQMIDEPEPSVTSKSMCAGRLNETMAVLREMAPADQQRDALDDLASRRSKRRAS